MPDTTATRTIDAVIRDGIDREAPRPPASHVAFWAGLAALGSQLWLDTGDIAAADRLWCADFTGLTTNNTLLNKEVQTGAYDGFLPVVAEAVEHLPPAERTLEAAFALNARHGLRLVQRFGCRVSVELHTDLADDAERSVAYGLRYHALCPDRFLVKLPFGAAGLIAARELGRRGVPVNLTLGFSARQNVLATVFARPAFVNVFIGRIHGYIAENKLGDGANAGERTLLASRRMVAATGGGRTRQIGASLRDPSQLRACAGCDVFTMPTKVAEDAPHRLEGSWSDHRDAEPAVHFSVDAAPLRAEVLWEPSRAVRALADDLAAQPPQSARELEQRAREAGCADLFPRLSQPDRERLAADGKIPRHAAWAPRIAGGELAIDTLLTQAGLAAFAADQAALDHHVRQAAGWGG